MDPSKPTPTMNMMKLILVGALGLVLMGGTVAYFALAPLLGPILFPPTWKSTFNRGMAKWGEDRNSAEELIIQGITESHKSAPLNEQIRLHRDYAQKLWDADNDIQGDDQIEQAIQLCKGDSAKEPAVAYELSEAYQDRAWDTHHRFLKDPKLQSGEKDQELSYSLAEKAFGPDSKDAIYKLATLGLIYQDSNQPEKAKEAFDKATTAADTKTTAKPAAWFVYAALARARATTGDYDGATEAFTKGSSLASSKNQKERLVSELKQGLKQQTSQTPTEPLQFSADSMLHAKQFEELDALAAKLRKAGTATADGTWVLDKFYDQLSNRKWDEAKHKQQIALCREWVKSRPPSPTARVALAQALNDYAWHARGGGYANTVTDKGWKLFKERLAEAKQALDEQPNLDKQCPRAAYLRIKLARGMSAEKPEYLALVRQGDALWPTYEKIDGEAVFGLLPRWFGDDGDWEKFAATRADTIGGAAGDARYAQLVWGNSWAFDDIIAESPGLDWSRIERGFAKIFSDYPNDVQSRVALIEMATQTRDDKKIKLALDTLKPSRENK